MEEEKEARGGLQQHEQRMQEQYWRSPQGLEAQRGPAAAAVAAAVAAAAARRNACAGLSTAPSLSGNNQSDKHLHLHLHGGTALGRGAAATGWQAAGGGKGGKGAANAGGKAWKDLVAGDWLKGDPEMDWRRGRLAGAGFPLPGQRPSAAAASWRRGGKAWRR